MTRSTLPALRVDGDRIVDAAGSPVWLRGVGIGGWLNMENFITGHPGAEQDMRATVTSALGDERAAAFFDRLLAAFFGPADAAHIARLGLNHVRIPVNYRHLVSDAEPGVIRDDAWRHLDRGIEACHDAGLYAVIDLHAAPGWQNQEWHSDNPTHRALLWGHRHFQDQTVLIWEAIADRYRGASHVAGYNLLNEPGDPRWSGLRQLGNRLHDAVRAIDADTMIFIDGNRYATEFDDLASGWENVVLAPHDYALAGFIDGGRYPGITRGEYVDRATVEATFLRRTAAARERSVPAWIGEFGPVYGGDAELDAQRYRLLADQLEIYARHRTHWCLWTYKDIGLQGLVHVRPDSPWLQLAAPIIEKKQRLGADAWGTTNERVAHLVDPLVELLEREFPSYHPYPFGVRRRVARLVQHILFTEPLVDEFGDLFAGLSDPDLEALADSFAFAACRPHDELGRLLAAAGDS